MVITVAFIPLRGGSKSIPGKNIKLLAGKPLAYWTIEAALACKGIDKVFVATDSPEISESILKIKNSKLVVIGRSAESATDTASTESAIIEFANQNQFENVVLIQATSPLLSSEHLESGLKKFNSGKFDSLLSAVRQKRFIWSESGNIASPNNYDPLQRPRRQDFDGYLVENGAFYITSRKALLETKCRLSGKIGIAEMPEETFVEIDEPSDWITVEGILRQRGPNSNLKEKLRKVRLVVSDVDGVLTDAGMYYSDRGDELKKFNTRDGKGFELLRRMGLETAIITSENTEVVARRAQKLKIANLHQGAIEKLPVLKDLIAKLKITVDEVLYIGDDVNDLEVMKLAGVSACPADAVAEIKSISSYVCELKGGQGCLREVVSLITQARG